jgi:hypothetical protein
MSTSVAPKFAQNINVNLDQHDAINTEIMQPKQIACGGCSNGLIIKDTPEGRDLQQAIGNAIIRQTGANINKLEIQLKRPQLGTVTASDVNNALKKFNDTYERKIPLDIKVAMNNYYNKEKPYQPYINSTENTIQQRMPRTLINLVNYLTRSIIESKENKPLGLKLEEAIIDLKNKPRPKNDTNAPDLNPLQRNSLYYMQRDPSASVFE